MRWSTVSCAMPADVAGSNDQPRLDEVSVERRNVDATERGRASALDAGTAELDAETAELDGADVLDGADAVVVGADFTDQVFAGERWTGRRFVDCRFTEVDLRGLITERCEFTE